MTSLRFMVYAAGLPLETIRSMRDGSVPRVGDGILLEGLGTAKDVYAIVWTPWSEFSAATVVMHPHQVTASEGARLLERGWKKCVE